MKALFSLIVAACISLAFLSPERLAMDSPDKAFALKAADGGMAEVMLGSLAEKNGGSPKVKEFGKMMVKDHTKVNDELKAVAKTKQIMLPAKLSGAKQADYDKLASLKGDQFDKAYMDKMVSSHLETIALFQAEATNGEDPELKKWAEAKLPALKHHLEMAKMNVAGRKK